MADRDRLIELLSESPWDYLICKSNRASLADHLLANGVIVPPCPIGSRIYMLVTRKTHSFEFKNKKMIRLENQHTFIFKTHLTRRNFFKIIDSFGKTTFLTEEEAEAKLKELQSETQSVKG